MVFSVNILSRNRKKEYTGKLYKKYLSAVFESAIIHSFAREMAISGALAWIASWHWTIQSVIQQQLSEYPAEQPLPCGKWIIYLQFSCQIIRISECLLKIWRITGLTTYELPKVLEKVFTCGRYWAASPRAASELSNHSHFASSFLASSWFLAIKLSAIPIHRGHSAKSMGKCTK